MGEPPFFMAASAFFAIKDAVASARKDHGETGFFRLNSPASSERLVGSLVSNSEQVRFIERWCNLCLLLAAQSHLLDP